MEKIVVKQTYSLLIKYSIYKILYMVGDNMPNFDRTGPMGGGPRTGRGRGKCRGYNLDDRGSRGLSSNWTKILVPIITAAAEEILNPKSIFNRKIKQIFSKKSPKEIELKPDMKKLEHKSE